MKSTIENLKLIKDSLDRTVKVATKQLEEVRGAFETAVAAVTLEIHSKNDQRKSGCVSPKKRSIPSSERVRLRVGGKEFTTTKGTLLLEKETHFATIFGSGRWSPHPGEVISIDRDPTHFGTILDYMRSGTILDEDKITGDQLEKFVSEVQFYQIGSLLKKLGLSDTVEKHKLQVVAGTHNKAGHCGDGRAATSALLTSPVGVCYHKGNIFIVDDAKHCIRMVDKGGIMSTIAGCGEVGLQGDGGLALDACFTWPQRVCVYGDVLYVTDYQCHLVRGIDLKTRIVDTIVGTGEAGSGGDGGIATFAQLNCPVGISASHGQLFIGDFGNHKIRVVNLSTRIIHTLVGSGACGYKGNRKAASMAELSHPTDLCIHDNILYFSDSGNFCVRSLNMKTGLVDLVAGCGVEGYSGDGGPAVECKLQRPRGLVATYSFLYIADRFADCIRRVNLETGIIETVWGANQLQSPVGLGLANDQLLVADNKNCVVKVSLTNPNLVPPSKQWAE